MKDNKKNIFNGFLILIAVFLFGKALDYTPVESFFKSPIANADVASGESESESEGDPDGSCVSEGDGGCEGQGQGCDSG